jgi:hypothetical protein
MTPLNEKQCQFSDMLVKLIRWANANGYQVSIWEVVRSKAQALADQADGTGIAHSLHLIGLAADLHVFKDGVYLMKTPEYEPLGEMWEQMGGSWGGRFTKPDGNHFSLEHNGVR